MFKKESRSACFGTKMVPCLWRVDLSFRNSNTGSGNIAKCSKILQDRGLANLKSYQSGHSRRRVGFRMRLERHGVDLEGGLDRSRVQLESNRTRRKLVTIDGMLPFPGSHHRPKKLKKVLFFSLKICFCCGAGPFCQTVITTLFHTAATKCQSENNCMHNLRTSLCSCSVVQGHENSYFSCTGMN